MSASSLTIHSIDDGDFEPANPPSISGANSTRVNITGLLATTTYRFVVAARSSLGAGPDSAPSAAVTTKVKVVPLNHLPLVPISKLSCGLLGWAVEPSHSVCASSKMFGDFCASKLSFDAAVSFCDAAGARLCTSEELSLDIGEGLPCEFENDYVRTSTQCDPKNPKSTISRTLTPQYSGVNPPVCSPEQQSVRTVCCADAFPVSQKTCGAFDWQTVQVDSQILQPSPVEQTKSICASAQILGGCSTTDVYYEDAVAFCDGIGARLCSASELQAGVGITAAQTCGWTETYVWTSSLCQGDEVLVGMADSRRKTNSSKSFAQCVSRTLEQMKPLCCADQPVNHCDAEVSCLNNGTCTSGQYNFTCECPPGFAGDQCEIEPNACESYPCLNGGTCVDRSGGNYVCQCADGFNGTTCQNQLDGCERRELAGQYCQNGASCVAVGKSDSICDCAGAWRGELCDVIDVCHVDPCRNGGRCDPSGDSYSCTCASAFFGQNCQYDFKGRILQQLASVKVPSKRSFVYTYSPSDVNSDITISFTLTGNLTIYGAVVPPSSQTDFQVPSEQFNSFVMRSPTLTKVRLSESFSLSDPEFNYNVDHAMIVLRVDGYHTESYFSVSVLETRHLFSDKRQSVLSTLDTIRPVTLEKETVAAKSYRHFVVPVVRGRQGIVQVWTQFGSLTAIYADWNKQPKEQTSQYEGLFTRGYAQLLLPEEVPLSARGVDNNPAVLYVSVLSKRTSEFTFRLSFASCLPPCSEGVVCELRSDRPLDSGNSITGTCREEETETTTAISTDEPSGMFGSDLDDWVWYLIFCLVAICVLACIVSCVALFICRKQQTQPQPVPQPVPQAIPPVEKHVEVSSPILDEQKVISNGHFTQAGTLIVSKPDIQNISPNRVNIEHYDSDPAPQHLAEVDFVFHDEPQTQLTYVTNSSSHAEYVPEFRQVDVRTPRAQQPLLATM